MRILLSVAFVSFACTNSLGQTTYGVCRNCYQSPDTLEGEYIFTVVEQMPKYPGGTAALTKYLSKNIKYIHQGEQFIGAITISFIIDANGMVRGECICLPPTRISLITQEKEALQAIRQMPQWIPGKQNGKNVPVRYRLPIRF